MIWYLQDEKALPDKRKPRLDAFCKCDICAKILYVLQPDICIGTFADIRVPQLQIFGL